MFFSFHTPYIFATSAVWSESSGKLRLCLSRELLVALERVGRDAEDDRVLFREIGFVIAERARLRGAAGRVVLRVEVEDHVLALELACSDISLPRVEGRRKSGATSPTFGS